MKIADVVVIGGSPAGITVAITVRRHCSEGDIYMKSIFNYLFEWR